ncbi:GGDEF domain-containing protein [Klebsiella pneumoniae subsp. pneumoniae]|nr:GGDEF domain-containing protein [Klebsiella pneumoniae subsp. pneumoniae]
MFVWKTLANDLQASKEKLQVQNRRLQYDAYHDSLTGMPNRLSFWQRLQERSSTSASV